MLGIAVRPALTMIAPRYLFRRQLLRADYSEMHAPRQQHKPRLMRAEWRGFTIQEANIDRNRSKVSGNGNGRREAMAVASMVIALLLKHPTLGMMAVISFIAGVVLVRGERAGKVELFGLKVLGVLLTTAKTVMTMFLLWLPTRGSCQERHHRV